MADGVVIKIDGDDSGYREKLESLERQAKETAKTLETQFEKIGKAADDSLGKATSEAVKEQKDALKEASKSVDDVVEKNEGLIDQKDDMADVYDGMGNSAEKASRKAKMGLADIKAGLDLIAAGIKVVSGIAGSGIGYNAQIEQLQTSFEVMTGSAEKAAEVVERLRVMGAETPFEMTDLASTTQLLMQYGFSADEAIDRMTMLGDIAQGNAQAMTSVATGYAQMASAGKVSLVDIKQMINICHAA